MQPCSREMQAMNSLLNQSSQIPLHQDLQNQHHQQQQQIQGPHFDPSSSLSNDDFLEQILSIFPSCSWADLKSPCCDLNPTAATTASLCMPIQNGAAKLPGDLSDETAVVFDESSLLASKMRHHQMQQKQLTMATRGALQPHNDAVDGPAFSSPIQEGDGSLHPLYNGFGAGPMHGVGQTSTQSQHRFHHPQGGGAMQAQNFGASGAVRNQTQASGSIGGDAPAQQKPRVRARRGQATDPHSIAERLRRERISERMKALQVLVPNANKTDKASMLDEIIDYVKFLRLQVKVLSMSRLGVATAVGPVVADMSSEGGGGGDCIQTSANGGSLGQGSNGAQTASSNDSLTVTEQQVAKLIEEDMASAMQYLQGKGLCLMPISLATAISTANRNAVIVNGSHHPLLHSNGEGPSSPTMSVLTVQSAAMGNGTGDASVSKP
uniref:Uncharacterized protein MANES_14G112400 n=1 Tax=Rhizophora mucronata TaxID=61149 RepID=A0A2P2L8K9_RHIMU